MSLYPLTFRPVYLPKVWGGRALERLGRTLPESGPIGEAWELADLPATHQEGAGGQPVQSVVATGPLAGRTLNQLLKDHQQDLMGCLKPTPDGGFPLLIKLLSSEQNLSVQVHPSSAYAKTHPEARLKNEAWYVLHAAPDAVIYKGLKKGTTPQAVREALQTGSLEESLIRVPARAGDFHYLPGGTCHALSAGMVIAEIQTPSDTTFRLYDWGRTDRALHIDQALDSLYDGPVETGMAEPRTRIERPESLLETLVNCEHFRIEKIRYHAPHRVDLSPSNEPRIWMILEGAGDFFCSGLPAGEFGFSPVQTILLPAAITHAQACFNGPATLLQITFPAAGSDLIA